MRAGKVRLGAGGAEPDPARACDREGFAERAGVRLAWRVYGEEQRPTVLLMPTWSIVPSRFWKLQVPYLARHLRVVTFDGRGSGRSGRPEGAAAYQHEEYAADAVACSMPPAPTLRHSCPCRAVRPGPCMSRPAIQTG